jgi:hypothetical protein
MAPLLIHFLNFLYRQLGSSLAPLLVHFFNLLLSKRSSYMVHFLINVLKIMMYKLTYCISGGIKTISIV